MIDTRARKVATALLSMLSVTACAATPIPFLTAADVTAPPSTASPAPQTSGWIINAHTLNNLLAHDQTGVVTRALDIPTTYLVVKGPNQVPSVWTNTIPTQSFTSSDTLVKTVTGHTLISGVRAVML